MKAPGLYNLYDDSIIPHDNINDQLHDGIQRVLSRHNEIPREEYYYSWNTHGLRSIEFDLKPEIITMGCSITFGLGLPDEYRWNNMLQDKLKDHESNMLIGDLSYNGAAPMKNVISFFNYVKQMDYLPKYVICNFSNLERLYFPNSTIDHMGDLFWYPDKIATKATAPFNFGEILPLEWLYFLNLDYIKMLEIFCEKNDIKLIWSTWSTNLSDEMEEFLSKNFNSYYPDPTRKEFPSAFETRFKCESLDNLYTFYRMNNYDNVLCHSKLKENSAEIFDYAYDYHQIKVPYVDGLVPMHPHPGVHRHAHWSEFYFDQLIKIGI